MKILENKMTPNGRRVRVFLAEKDINMDYEQIDIMKGENLSKEFREKNASGRVPVLELDDGTHISESVAICRYFEELHPDRAPLFGKDALEKAKIEMWNRRAEMELFISVALCFRNTSGFFKDREKCFQDFGEESGVAAKKTLKRFNRHMENSTYLAGEDFSIADITLLCSIDFAAFADIKINEEDHPHLMRWHKLVSERPSAKA